MAQDEARAIVDADPRAGATRAPRGWCARSRSGGRGGWRWRGWGERDRSPGPALRSSAMCGMTGWVDWERDLRDQRDVLLKMARTLALRGPDAEGTFVTERAALAHRRLIVLDPEGGKQPMSCKYGERTYAITYNGELYNFVELRRELDRTGAPVRDALGYGGAAARLRRMGRATASSGSTASSRSGSGTGHSSGWCWRATTWG